MVFGVRRINFKKVFFNLIDILILLSEILIICRLVLLWQSLYFKDYIL